MYSEVSCIMGNGPHMPSYGQADMYENCHVIKTKSWLKVTHGFIPRKIQWHMSHFAYACKTEGNNGISRLISETA